MRISKTIRIVAMLALMTAPALAFDGSKTDEACATTVEAFRYGAQALKVGETKKAVTSLECAAEKGHALAQWKLGRMYADGDGVPKNDLRAFEYFRSVANSHADDNPAAPQARFVANAFVALGHYWLEGIPKSEVTANPARARQMFDYAASYFGDPDGQYYLARMYMEGIGGSPRDPKQAARWFGASAQKGHCQAQGRLGAMLFTGEGGLPRQSARGLMWLTLAKDCAAAGNQGWITKIYDSAFQQATEDERALALVYLQRWMATRRE